jgi:hypothetical protein
MPRKPGGQPGNTNALRHGFYSRKFRKLEIDDLDTALIDGLTDEITCARICYRRLFEIINDSDTNLETMTTSVTALSACFARLAGLLRTQKMLGGEGDTFDTLHRALKEIIDERHISV